MIHHDDSSSTAPTGVRNSTSGNGATAGHRQKNEGVIMPEMTTISSVELAHLEERVQKLSKDKSHLQLINSLMNRVSAAQGLNNMITVLLSNILDVIGGLN